MSSSRPISRSSLDGRTELGYGRSSSYFQKSRKSSNSFPYLDKYLDISDIDTDEETEKALKIKINKIIPMDSLAYKKTDIGHYVNPNSILRQQESITSINALSPIPNLYKKRSGAFGGTAPISVSPGPASGFKSRSRPIGDKRGWSSAPKVIWNEDDESYIYSLEDSPDEILREYIRMLIMGKV